MEDATSYFITQGALGIGVVVLAGVVIKLYNKIERQYQKIEELQELRLQDSKEVNKDYSEIVQGNTQSNLILAEKIEVSKKRGA